MPVNTDIKIPFLPQESLTNSILTAIQLANEHAQQLRQSSFQQQQLAQQAPLTQAQTGLAGAQTAEAQQNVQTQKLALDMRQREMEYVFGAGAGGGQPTGEQGATEQKPGLYSDMLETKKRLKLSDEESAQFDQAMRNVQAGFLSTGKLDMTPVDKVVQDHLAKQNAKDLSLHPTFRMEGNQWYQDMHTAEGKLAYSVPVPPPADYLSHTTEGVDYMRTVDAQTGKVTITPIETSRVTKPVLPGQPVPSPKISGGPSGEQPGKPFELPGAGKKLSEAGQSMITGLTQATDLTQPAITFLSKTPPSNVDWYKAVAMYKLHMNPPPEFSNTFQAIGLARAIATGPLLHGIRNERIIRGIQEHLPDLTDSPALALKKLKDLQPFWKQAMKEVYKTENVNEPNAGLSDAASEYLKSIGVPH